MWTERTRGARHRDEQRLEVAVEPERHLRDLCALDDAVRVGAIGLQHRCLAGYDHRLFELTHRKNNFHADRGVDADLHSLAGEFLEANELAIDAVNARSKIVEGIITGRVCDSGARDVRPRL